MNKLLSITLILAAVLALGACRRGPFSGYNEIKEVLVANSSEIQEHIDRYFSLASSWLNDRRNQREIASLLQRAQRISRMIYIPTLKNLLLETVDDAFNVLETLQSKLNQTLHDILALPDIPATPLLYSNPSDRTFRTFDQSFREFSLSSYQMNVTRNFIKFRNESLEELDNLKFRVLGRFSKVALGFLRDLSFADQETALDVIRLIKAADRLFIRHLERSLSFMFKLDNGAQILELVESFQPRREGNNTLQLRVRNIVRDLASDLNRINLLPLRNLSKDLISVVLEDLHDTRRQLERASMDALTDWERSSHLYQDSEASDASNSSNASVNSSGQNDSFSFNDSESGNTSDFYKSLQYTFGAWNPSYNGSSWGYNDPWRSPSGPPGRIIDDALNRLRQGLGEKLANFREKLLKDIHGVLRDTLKSLGYTNVPEINDPNLPSKTHLIVEKVKRRVEEVMRVLNSVWKEEFYNYYWHGSGYYYN